jgi:transketolase
MMKLPTIYVFTHDSVLLGEDGPTHQPVEQLASLRAVPNLLVLRPGDAEETAAAWKMAIAREDGPTALILSRQPLRVYEKADAGWEETVGHGGYVVSDAKGRPKIVLIATGSEVNLALETKRLLGSDDVRVVSMMCRELFNKAPSGVQEKLVPAEARRIVLEAGVSLGWEGIAGKSGRIFCVETYGQSATMKEVQELFQFEPQRVCAAAKEMLADEGRTPARW